MRPSRSTACEKRLERRAAVHEVPPRRVPSSQTRYAFESQSGCMLRSTGTAVGYREPDDGGTMAGLLARAATVVKAKFSKLLDRAENPAETLDYSYEQQLGSSRT